MILLRGLATSASIQPIALASKSNDLAGRSNRPLAGTLDWVWNRCSRLSAFISCLDVAVINRPDVFEGTLQIKRSPVRAPLNMNGTLLWQDIERRTMDNAVQRIASKNDRHVQQILAGHEWHRCNVASCSNFSIRCVDFGVAPR